MEACLLSWKVCHACVCHRSCGLKNLEAKIDRCNLPQWNAKISTNGIMVYWPATMVAIAWPLCPHLGKTYSEQYTVSWVICIKTKSAKKSLLSGMRNQELLFVSSPCCGHFEALRQIFMVYCIERLGHGHEKFNKGNNLCKSRKTFLLEQQTFTFRPIIAARTTYMHGAQRVHGPWTCAKCMGHRAWHP
jgi:hypothetical protein